MKIIRKGFLLLLVVVVFSGITSAGELIVFHAGSLAVPFKEISEAFIKEHPQVKILREAAGSRACARKISEINRPCDLIASADYTVIDTLLIPGHASWNLKFAANEMVIAFSEKSRYQDEITADNWHQILLKEDAAFGRADPNSDPCGYRSVMTIKLAEKHYQAPGITEVFLQKDLDKIRPKETDLLALLEVGEIDYLFIYRSVAQQHGLEFLILPDEVNLKNAELSELYASVSASISGKTPGSKLEKKGAAMVYGLTIPANAPNPELALEFVNYLLTQDGGMEIMQMNGQPSVVPSPTETYKNIPDLLKKFAVPVVKAVEKNAGE